MLLAAHAPRLEANCVEHATATHPPELPLTQVLPNEATPTMGTSLESQTTSEVCVSVTPIQQASLDVVAGTSLASVSFTDQPVEVVVAGPPEAAASAGTLTAACARASEGQKVHDIDDTELVPVVGSAPRQMPPVDIQGTVGVSLACSVEAPEPLWIASTPTSSVEFPQGLASHGRSRTSCRGESSLITASSTQQCSSTAVVATRDAGNGSGVMALQGTRQMATSLADLPSAVGCRRKSTTASRVSALSTSAVSSSAAVESTEPMGDDWRQSVAEVGTFSSACLASSGVHDADAPEELRSSSRSVGGVKPAPQVLASPSIAGGHRRSECSTRGSSGRRSKCSSPDSRVSASYPMAPAEAHGRIRLSDLPASCQLSMPTAPGEDGSQFVEERKRDCGSIVTSHSHVSELPMPIIHQEGPLVAPFESLCHGHASEVERGAVPQQDDDVMPAEVAPFSIHLHSPIKSLQLSNAAELLEATVSVRSLVSSSPPPSKSCLSSVLAAVPVDPLSDSIGLGGKGASPLRDNDSVRGCLKVGQHAVADAPAVLSREVVVNAYSAEDAFRKAPTEWEDIVSSVAEVDRPLQTDNHVSLCGCAFASQDCLVEEGEREGEEVVEDTEHDEAEEAGDVYPRRKGPMSVMRVVMQGEAYTNTMEDVAEDKAGSYKPNAGHRLMWEKGEEFVLPPTDHPTPSLGAPCFGSQCPPRRSLPDVGGSAAATRQEEEESTTSESGESSPPLSEESFELRRGAHISGDFDLLRASRQQSEAHHRVSVIDEAVPRLKGRDVEVGPSRATMSGGWPHLGDECVGPSHCGEGGSVSGGSSAYRASPAPDLRSSTPTEGSLGGSSELDTDDDGSSDSSTVIHVRLATIEVRGADDASQRSPDMCVHASNDADRTVVPFDDEPTEAGDTPQSCSLIVCALKESLAAAVFVPPRMGSHEAPNAGRALGLAVVRRVWRSLTVGKRCALASCCCAGLLLPLCALIVVLSSIHVLGEYDQVVVKSSSGWWVRNGPWTGVLDPLKTKAYRKATMLEESQYAVVENARTGRRRVEVGPSSFFMGAYEDVLHARRKEVILSSEYAWVRNVMTGAVHTVGGPAIHVPGPYDDVADVRPKPVIEPGLYALVLDNFTGVLRTEGGPQVLLPGPYDHIVNISHKFVLERHEYLRLLDRHTGRERVVTGPRDVVPSPGEEAPLGVQHGVPIGAGVAALVHKKDSGEQRLITEGGIFVPEAYEEVLEERLLIHVEPHEVVVVRSADGHLIVHSGVPNGRSFFLPPYCHILEMHWTSHPALDKTTARTVTRIDLRVQQMVFEVIARTYDKVQLRLLGIVFWRIRDVARMLVATADPEDDVWHRARGSLLKAVARVTLATFMASVSNFSRVKGEDPGGFLEVRGLEVGSMEVTRFGVVDAAAAASLQDVIRGTINRTNRLQAQDGDNEVRAARLAGETIREQRRAELVRARSVNARLLAENDGKAQGLELARHASTFMHGLNASLPSIDARSDLYTLYRTLEGRGADVANLAITNGNFHLSPWTL